MAKNKTAKTIHSNVKSGQNSLPSVITKPAPPKVKISPGGKPK